MRLGPFPAPPRLSAPQFSSARGFSRPALPRAWGRLRPLRAFLRRGFPLRGDFPARRLPRAWGHLRPLRAFLRRGFPLREKVSLARRFCAPAAGSGLSARFCAALSICVGNSPRPALLRVCGRFRPLCAPLCRGFPLRGKFLRPAISRACGRFPALRASLRRRFPLREKVSLSRRLRASAAVSGLSARLCAALSICAGNSPRPALSRACGWFPASYLSNTLHFPSARETA